MRRRSAQILVAFLLTIMSAGSGHPIAADEPAYVQRLSLPGREDTIGFPSAVTADLSADEIFVCDRTLNRILIFDAQGAFTYEIAGGEIFRAPKDIAVDPDGFLFVVANHDNLPALLELDYDGLFIRRVELSELPAGIEPLQPTSVAFSETTDHLYVVDGANMSLWIANRSGEIQKQIDLAAGMAEEDRRDVMLGHVDVYGSQVLVTHTSGGEIRIFDLAGNYLGVVGVKGGAPCKLGRPSAAAIDANGDVFLVDHQKMVISRWQKDGNKCKSEYWGIGMSPGFLYYPVDIALDRSGNLFVAQGWEGRVQMYEGLAPAASP